MEIITTDFENWGPYLMKQFQIMYEKGERCDLEISCRKQIFMVHRLIMSACSDYVKELNEKQHIILPEEVSCKALKTVIDFVYSGKITYSKEDKDDLLLAANLLNMRLLTELIKMQESCSFTLSMDEEIEDQNTSEPVNNNVKVDCTELNNSDGYQKTSEVPNPIGTKRKSETRSNRNRSAKNNAILPPLFKFPYLQQKFSASRTYGLITNLTDPVPSRFEISDAELLESSYRSTFEDVTYETETLFKNPSCLATLDQVHLEFLKKIKENVNPRRCYSNALYSPFDKYTPPYNFNADATVNKRRESYVSYPPKIGSVVTSYGRKSKLSTPIPETCSVPKSVSSLKTSGTVTTTTCTVSSNNSISISSSNSSISSSSTSSSSSISSSNSNNNNNNALPVEKHVRFADIIDIREVDMELDDPMNDFNMLPKPVSPVPPELVQTPPIESDEKVELIKLNNAVPLDIDERPVSEELPDVSISVVADQRETNDIKHEMDENDIMVIEKTTKKTDILTPVPCILETFITPDSVSPPASSPTSLPPGNVYVNNDCSIDKNISQPQTEENVILNQCENNAMHETTNVNSPVMSAVSADASSVIGNSIDFSAQSSVQSILTDTTVFTPLSSANSLEIPTEPHSQMFALKVKGTENPAQLNKLVDLCKKNPLFKNKNVRFKIVPVKGPIPETLKDQSRATAAFGIKKAIIVKRTEKVTSISEDGKNIIENCSFKKKEKLRFGIENVNGPWNCVTCGEVDKPLTFGTYFDYRTHLHSVHKEANNPVYCMYCGYKSLKRNMQLYHLFIKHNVAPPTHLKFPKCDKCNFYGLNEYYLQKHLACHPPTGSLYVCSCKSSFKTSDLLQKHMVSGDCKNSKSFTCGYCRCIFDRFVNLKAHMRVCMKERSKPSLQNNVIENSPERTT